MADQFNGVSTNTCSLWRWAPLYFGLLRKLGSGRRRLGKRASRHQSSPISIVSAFHPARAVGRHLATLLSSAIFFIGYLIQPFTRKRQALHDIIASTLVLRK